MKLTDGELGCSGVFPCVDLTVEEQKFNRHGQWMLEYEIVAARTTGTVLFDVSVRLLIRRCTDCIIVPIWAQMLLWLPASGFRLPAFLGKASVVMLPAQSAAEVIDGYRSVLMSGR